MKSFYSDVEPDGYGNYVLKNKPSIEELSKYYSEMYYQSAQGGYELEYSKEELDYFESKIEQKYKIVENRVDLTNQNSMRLLDVGCGEGWTLDFFFKKGWEVKGLDFSNFGIQKFNPHLSSFVQQGDVSLSIEELTTQKKSYNFISLINVLEHVYNPFDLLVKLRNLADLSCILVVEVPNDFSTLQLKAYNEGLIDKPFWVAIPDHLYYFNKDGLIKLAEATGWECIDVLADFPIDFNLFNLNSNYVMDKTKGKGSHLQRVKVENMIHGISPDHANEFYRSLAKLGLGRQISVFLKPQKID